MSNTPKPTNHNTILTFEKTMTKGVKKLKLIGFSHVNTYDQLPSDYVNDYPFYYAKDHIDEIVIHTSNSSPTVLRLNDEYSLDRVKDIITVMKVSGNRLATINHRIKKDLKTWHGITNIEI